jgi:uncharacterized protein (DUF1499 family)
MMEALRSLVRFFEAVGQVAGVVLLVAVVVGVGVFIWLGAVSRKMPPRVSPTGGPLRADGANPNWVSSTAPARDILHFIPPRRCADNPIPALVKVLGQEPGITVVDATERYVHATARSSRFGFVDDVELLYDPAAGLLHARSASRVGKSDLGVNRRRLEKLFKDAGL